MGRPRKPTASHELQGTRPGATNRDRPDSKKALAEIARIGGDNLTTRPLGDPPEWFYKKIEVERAGRKLKIDNPALACWYEIVEALPKGVATDADRFVIEVAASLLGRFRSSGGFIASSDIALLHRSLATLGMTPADRSKVGVQVPRGGGEVKESDPWDQLGPSGRA